MNSFPAIEIDKVKAWDFRLIDENTAESLNVAYGVDSNYLDGVGVSITSIVINNRHVNLDFYIIADVYNDDFFQKVEKLAEQYQLRITLYRINTDNLQCLPCTQVWSRAMYFRLFAFQLLGVTLNGLLYLDADVVCKGNISQLLHLEFNGAVAAVVRDVDPMQEKAVVRLSDPELRGQYFNSGVVYLDLKKWTEAKLTEKALSILMSKDSIYKYPDQDVMNVLLKGMTIFLPREFNTIYTIKSELKDKTHQKYKELIKEDTLLIHYTGATKPWHKWAIYPSVKYYKIALERSPWKDDS
ncbi:lipopolysaccharide 1,2-glucosyltransferase RfaJ, partial [Escherichia coli]|uniref:lipopolysaccharide 1,2-glucosyltransferase RfaJ n=1 Tax=Escherichia coli TaxID=562 RepID=UPI00234D309D